MRTKITLWAAPCVLVLARGLAFAQGATTETTTTGGGAPASTAPAGAASTSAAPAASLPPSLATGGSRMVPDKPATADEPRADELGDHQSVVHHLAVGYLGVSQIPVAQVSTGALTQGSVTAPVLGVRYWLGERIGVDVGLGLGVSKALASQSFGGVSTSNDSPAIFGFALHGGLPLALAYSKHFAFELIPEIDFGYAGTTLSGGGVTPDTGLNGIRLDLGARIGAEVQFGFIGIPQLSLQGSIGLSFRYSTVWASQDTSSASASTIDVGTTFQNDPWAIFTDSVSALYYF